MCLGCDRNLCCSKCLEDHNQHGCRVGIAEQDIDPSLPDDVVALIANKIGVDQFVARHKKKWTKVPGAIPTLPFTYTVAARRPSTLFLQSSALCVCGLLEPAAVPTKEYIDSVQREEVRIDTADSHRRRHDGYNRSVYALDQDDCAALTDNDWERIAKRFALPVEAKPASVTPLEYLKMACRLRQVSEDVLDIDTRTCTPNELSDAKLVWACAFLELRATASL